MSKDPFRPIQTVSPEGFRRALEICAAPPRVDVRETWERAKKQFPKTLAYLADSPTERT